MPATTHPAGEFVVMDNPRHAWAAYEPDRDHPWDLKRAAHLYRRTAFAGTWPQLQQAMRDGPRQTIDRLIKPPREQVDPFNQQHDSMEAAAANSIEQLRAWWLRRMITTPDPLTEIITLFWHNRFAVRADRAGSGRVMLGYLRLLRAHAMGQYGPMLTATVRDPAVLKSYDAEANRKAQPSDHFARRLLRRLGPGDGHYTDADVAAAACSMTGWYALRGNARFIEREHDAAAGSSDDLVRHVLADRATAEQLARDLYRWLISDVDPPAALIEPLIEALYPEYHIKPVVEMMLRSNLFFNDVAYRRRVKSPVELAVGLIRSLEGLVPTEPLGRDLTALGHDVLNPPTAAGWPHGPRWINTISLLGRADLVGSLLAAKGPYEGKLDIAPDQRSTTFVLNLLVQNDLPDAAANALLADAAPDHLRQLTHAVCCLPEYQLA